MANTELAYINGAILRWAIDRSNITDAALAAKLRITEDELRAWINNDAHPQFGIALRVADILHVPFGCLYLSNPPVDTTPLPDLRRLPHTAHREPSVNFTDLLGEVMSRQDWYREYLIQQREQPLDFVGSHPTRNAKAVARSIRETLVITPNSRHLVRGKEGYLSLLSQYAEARGILVMRSSLVGNNTGRKLSVSEFQGFAIADEFAPLVFVNSADYKAPQIFTLIHEIAHIWIGESGISNPDETNMIDIPPVRRDAERIERFCNSVAAEVLVPEEEFAQMFTPLADLQSLARHFWVSTLVILRRAHELGKITDSQFFSLLEKERAAIRAPKKAGGDFFQNIDARFGKTFPKALARDVKQGGTLYRDAASLLAIRVPTVRKLIERLT